MSRSADRLRLTPEGHPRRVKRSTAMKFMLMMNTPRAGEYQVMQWPKADLQRHIQFMMDFAKKLRAAGELIGAEGLAAPSQAKLVRAGANGKPITDGPFAESKEFLAGYWI